MSPFATITFEACITDKLLLSSSKLFGSIAEVGLKKLCRVSGRGPEDFFFFLEGPSPIISPLNDFPNSMDDG
jgi:hypothetical protein